MPEITVDPSGGINLMLLGAAWWNNHTHTFTLGDEGAGVDLYGIYPTQFVGWHNSLDI